MQLGPFLDNKAHQKRDLVHQMKIFNNLIMMEFQIMKPVESIVLNYSASIGNHLFFVYTTPNLHSSLEII